MGGLGPVHLGIVCRASLSRPLPGIACHVLTSAWARVALLRIPSLALAHTR
jgi:hypothetical protein